MNNVDFKRRNLSASPLSALKATNTSRRRWQHHLPVRPQYPLLSLLCAIEVPVSMSLYCGVDWRGYCEPCQRRCHLRASWPGVSGEGGEGGLNNAKICAQWAAVERRHCSAMIGHASFPVPTPHKSNNSLTWATSDEILPTSAGLYLRNVPEMSSKVHLFIDMVSIFSLVLLNVHMHRSPLTLKPYPAPKSVF